MGGQASKDTQQMLSRDWNGAGKVAIVTGPMGNGIGFQSARWLAERGCHVVLAGRGAPRLAECAKQIKAACKKADGTPVDPEKIQLSEIPLDLSSLASVESFVREFQALNKPLNILLNNAGVFFLDGQTVDGFDAQVGINYVDLTQLLMPQLQAGAPSRVVNVASAAHNLWAKMTTENFDEVFRPNEKQYGKSTSYSNSKLANILHARSLNAKYSESGVTAYSLHPGVVKTDIGRNGWATVAFFKVGGMFMKGPIEGSGTSIFCATNPDALPNAGRYFDRCIVTSEVSRAATDDVLAEALWVRTEQEITQWKAKQQQQQQQQQQAAPQQAESKQ